MILVFGTVCLDHVMTVPRLPELGGYVAIETEATYLGGEAANTANVLRSWGADVTLIGNDLGTDYEGDLLRRLLQEHGLSYPLEQHRGKAPVCDIYVTPDGERTMFGRGFSNMEPAIDLDQLPFEKGRWFVAEPNMSEISRRVAKEAKQRGMRLYLMDFFRENEPIGEGDFWQCSTDWVGQRGDNEGNIEWVQRWIDKTGCFAILTDGANGLVCGSPTYPVHHYAVPPAPKIVDTTGAGDTFRAGMVYALDQGWEIERCLAFASAAGALECGYIAATTRVPTSQEIDEFLGGRLLQPS